MGYASVAGLPVAYGLYGSILPTILFSLTTTSPRFFFGVDAAPAALTGGILAAAGIAAASENAIAMNGAITFLVSIWLLILFLCHADRLIKFISESVMGGFITGIGVVIILMQIPKLFGGSAGSDEYFIELLIHLYKEIAHFNAVSFLLGTLTVALCITGKKFFPKIPMQIILMALGALATYFLKLDSFGVRTLPHVEKGLPLVHIPNLKLVWEYKNQIVVPSLTIAVVILSETLLATNNIGMKHEDKINSRKEIMAYAAANFSSSLFGCCPVNGSVSRTGMADQFKVKSQIMSFSSGIFMLLIVLFRTEFIEYLPVPILTGIVISSLAGILEFKLAAKFRKVDKSEYLIFYAAFFSVLIFGTIYGVLVGLLLSSVTFIIRQSKPATSFLGIIKNVDGFHDVSKKNSSQIRNVIIYRFSAPLFYANINQFCTELEEKINEDTRLIIIDSSGISSVDLTASQRLVILYEKYKKRNIKFYIAGHDSSVNKMLKSFGAEKLIRERAVFSKIPLALSKANIKEPYETEDIKGETEKTVTAITEEFEWAFGNDAEKFMVSIAQTLAEKMISENNFNFSSCEDPDLIVAKKYWTDANEDEFLDMLSTQIESLTENDPVVDMQKENIIKQLEDKINLRHSQLEEKIFEKNEEAMKKIVHKRLERDLLLKRYHPKIYKKIEVEREMYFTEILMTNPGLAKKIAKIISEEENSYTKENPSSEKK